MDLLTLAGNNKYDREVISIVALLDVNENTMISMMGDVDKPEHHIIECRANVKQMVSAMHNGENNTSKL